MNTVQDTFIVMQSDDGDWQGLYRNGVLLAEGHSLDVGDTLTALGVPYTFEERDLSLSGRCPETLS